MRYLKNEQTLQVIKSSFHQYLTKFQLSDGSTNTSVKSLVLFEKEIPVFTNEFWTARQRQANPIHEVSYRACFKPQLPRFFIELFTKPGEIVYDPFNGRGTTVIEASLLNRNVISNDVNPLSLILTAPRISPPSLNQIEARLNEIPIDYHARADMDLSMFFEKNTLAEILSLKYYLATKHQKGKEDIVDKWIRMVATNRLTGHSNGFFSVYTLPPNQAVSASRQLKINASRNQQPEYRNTKKLILKKSKTLLSKPSNTQNGEIKFTLLNGDAGKTDNIKSNSVSLTVTSPPFLDIVQYADDNWMRCWFNGIDWQKVAQQITMSKTVEDWSVKMQEVFHELFRVTKPGGIVAFEVGEVRNGKIKLESAVIPLGLSAGFDCDCILINEQVFTKTANIWGVNNNQSGTNSNRIVVFRKK